MRRALGAVGSVLLLAAPLQASAGLSVGMGSSLSLGDATLDLGENDLVVAGSVAAGTDLLDRVGDLTIAPGGALNGESATIRVCGDWTNAGTFNAGTSLVQFVDGCGSTAAVIAGNSTFAGLDLHTSSGKLYKFSAGSMQTVTGVLTLLGAPGNLLAIRSTVDGSEAFLVVQGNAGGDFVDVQDNDASGGNPILLGGNSVTGSNTAGWILGAPVPSLSLLARTLAVLLVLGSAVRLLAKGIRRSGAT